MNTVGATAGVMTPRNTSRDWKRLRDVVMLEVGPDVIAYVRGCDDLDHDTRERIVGVLTAHAHDLEHSMWHLLSVILRMARAGHTGEVTL